MIKKVRGGYVIVSKTSGRRLSRVYKSKNSPAIKRREKQIIFFKNNREYLKDHGRRIPIRKRG